MEQYLRLQASVFGDFKEIDLSQESMAKLYQIYLKENMMPSIMKEFDVMSQNMKNRPNFIATDNSISVMIGSNRIDVMSDTSAGDKMVKKNEFIALAIKYLREFFEIFNVSVSRMSLILEGISQILEDSCEKQIEKQYIKLDRVFNSGGIFEWSANSVSLDEWDINEKKEKVNLNVTVAQRRLNGIRDGQPITTNALVITQDLNTQAENTALRLNASDIAEFLNLANEKSEIISKTIEGAEHE